MNNSSNINQSQNASIIYTTKTGRIISLSSDFNKTTTMCDLKSFQFNHNLGQNEVATSLIAFRQGKLLLVGTSSGRILIVNISFQRIVQDIVKKNNLKLPGIRTLVLSSGGHKFYSLHENSVYEWSIQLQKCLGYYSYNCPYSVLYTQRLSFNSPKILISGPNRFIEVIDAQNPKLISQV